MSQAMVRTGGAQVPLGAAPAVESNHSGVIRPRVIIAMDTTLSDSVRAIIERDLDYGDHLDVVVLDSVSRLALDTLELNDLLNEAEQYNVDWVVHVYRQKSTTVRVEAYPLTLEHAPRSALLTLRSDSTTGIPDRMDVHRLADVVQLWLAGTRGIAATRIAYVLGKNLHLVDSDGASDTVITTPGAVLSPVWNPEATAIAYADFNDAGTQIGMVDLLRDTVRIFSATRRGFNITPVFTPDGTQIVYAIQGVRGARLVSMRIAKPKAGVTAVIKKVLPQMRDMAEPSFSPDGRWLTFAASVPSYPQVYTVELQTGRIRRFVPYVPGLRNERTAPDWSPSGDRIVFQQQNRKFQIWIGRVRDGVADTVWRVTSVAENESPSWAPDGRHIVVSSTRGGAKTLWAFDVDSGRWRMIVNAPGARLASWSPRISGRAR